MGWAGCVHGLGCAVSLVHCQPCHVVLHPPLTTHTLSPLSLLPLPPAYPCLPTPADEPKEADIMSRPPRNPAVERLVSRRLISFSYFQIGIMQVGGRVQGVGEDGLVVG